MRPETYTAVKAIIESDQTISTEERTLILQFCRKPKSTNQDKPPTKFLTPIEVAKILQVHIKTVYRYEKKGILHRVALSSRSIRFPMDDIEAIHQQSISKVKLGN